MSSDVRIILGHMLTDTTDIVDFAEEIGSFDAFLSSRLYYKAIVMSIINIGELTKRLPQEYKSEHKEIPWKKIAGIRDIAAHSFHIMSDKIIWDVTLYSAPDLVQFLQSRLNE